MKRLRVAVVSDALYPWHKGGKEIRYLHLLQGLPELELDVAVYSMKWWDTTPDVVETQAGSLTYCAICPRVPLYRGTRRSVFQAILFAVSTLRLLTRKFDVIEADHMPYLQLLPLRIVAWLKRVPLVITWHEVWGREGWRTYLGPIGYAAALIESVAIRLPDSIVAVSPGTAEKLVAMGASRDKVVQIPNPIDLDPLGKTTPNTSAPELLFVGRLLEHKHADLAIEAVRVLVERGFDVRLGVIGVGPEEPRLRAQVTRMGLDARVTLYSTIDSQAELWSLIRGSRVMLAPSVREGFGLVVAESLALGTPVVCARHQDNESTKLIGSATGSLAEPFSAVAIADGAEFWLKDTSERTDRQKVFLAEHGELVGGAMASSYADLFRNLAES